MDDLRAIAQTILGDLKQQPGCFRPLYVVGARTVADLEPFFSTGPLVLLWNEEEIAPKRWAYNATANPDVARRAILRRVARENPYFAELVELFQNLALKMAQQVTDELMADFDAPPSALLARRPGQTHSAAWLAAAPIEDLAQ